jgi:hypothetical protein
MKIVAQKEKKVQNEIATLLFNNFKFSTRKYEESAFVGRM